MTEQGSMVDRHMAVKHLVLNFITPSTDDQHPLASHEERLQCLSARGGPVPAEYRNPYRKKLMRPEWMADSLCYLLRYMNAGASFAGTEYEEKYAGLMFERVGFITLQIDGRPYRELDVGAHVKSRVSYLELDVRTYKEGGVLYPVWIKEVLAARAAAGLA
ncbi:hypothetical protein PG993_005695 [Apiospora rasikravindrae]|uniref:Uncharacterized protein n=1 Tax=Apiospora rasikravindrae TaxID=990691 RepID=A0ABR1TBB9_9PEZI